jgi:hypothetical protein
MITSQRARWAEHVARRGEKRNTYRVLVGKLRIQKSGGLLYTQL